MTTTRRQMRSPARWLLSLCGLALVAGGLIAACAGGWIVYPPLQSSSALTPADDAADMPVPKRHNHFSFNTTHAPGVQAPLRVGLEIHVQAELSEVLAFYRRELGQRGWQEKPDDAVIAADRVQLAFASPKGPAVLKLERARDETMVSLAQRNPEAAAKANVLPKPGQARLIFGYLVPEVASLVINDQTIKIAGGENHPQALDLPPGRYSYELLVSGRPAGTNTITVAAGEAWNLRLGSDGDKPSQIY